MDYAVTLLEKGLRDVVATRGYLLANTWKQLPNLELLKVDYQIETIKNAIEFLKYRKRKLDSEIITILAEQHNLSETVVRNTVNEKSKYGR